jgi:hypothetical protein
VDWGVVDWQYVASNATARAIIEQAHSEAMLLREFVLDENEYFPFNSSGMVLCCVLCVIAHLPSVPPK